MDCGSHTVGGPLGLGLGGGGGWRGVVETDSPFGAAAGLAPAMGALWAACMRPLSSALIVESDLMLFLNHAFLDTRGCSGRRPDKYS